VKKKKKRPGEPCSGKTETSCGGTFTKHRGKTKGKKTTSKHPSTVKKQGPPLQSGRERERCLKKDPRQVPKNGVRSGNNNPNVKGTQKKEKSGNKRERGEVDVGEKIKKQLPV